MGGCPFAVIAFPAHSLAPPAVADWVKCGCVRLDESGVGLLVVALVSELAGTRCLELLAEYLLGLRCVSLLEVALVSELADT